ncbi:hypothetical protein, partial [Xanthomonas theicola]|uniref:hypothetical protein n=1 Tax=Xanthomonas theicola TaxID=56464 RepID=UPI001B8001BB
MGRPAKIQDNRAAVLVQIVACDPTATLEEVGDELVRPTGLKVHAQTLVGTLRGQGIERVASHEVVTVEPTAPAAMCYGYTQAHRWQEPEQIYPSRLTEPPRDWTAPQKLDERQGVSWRSTKGSSSWKSSR